MVSKRVRKKHALMEQEHASLPNYNEKYNAVLAKCKQKSQNYRILLHLINHGSITQREAAIQYNCWRLPARIFELRKRGAIIRTEDIPTISECASSSYARYYLEDVANEV